jgi:Flp pilus assembly pilin Flp
VKKAIEYAVVAGIGYALMSGTVTESTVNGEVQSRKFDFNLMRSAAYAALAFAYLYWREY